MHKLFRITTVSLSLDKLLHGQLGFMNRYYDVTAIASGEELLKKVAAKENVKVIHLPMTRQITPFADLKSVLGLYKLLKKEKPLIVHTHTPKAGIVGMLAARLAGVPNRLHTVAGLPLLEATGKKRQLLNLVEKLTYSLATKVYPNSFGLKDIIVRENFCSESKLKVIGQGSSNGIDTIFFSPSSFTTEEIAALKKKLGIDDSNFTFVFVGRLVSDKGINELVAAFDKFNKKYPLAKLMLVGDFEKELDPVKPAIETIIKQHPNIIAPGFISDVRPYLAVSDALAFPSYREGFPNVVMQAGAMGLPAIVSNINGCNEIIIDGKNGIIIPVKDEDALYLAMEQMLVDSGAYQHMKQSARDMICSRYEQNDVWEEILHEYKALEAQAVV